MKRCNICLALKAVCNKPYEDLQSLLISTHPKKDLFMDFVIGLLVSTNWKNEIQNSILVNLNRLTKRVYQKMVKITIDALGLAEVIINIIVRQHGLPKLIINDCSLVFISRFQSSLCNFFGIKRKPLTTFHPQTYGWTKKQNSTIKIYLLVFVNCKQNNCARLPLMLEFAYNNVRNISIKYSIF